MQQAFIDQLSQRAEAHPDLLAAWLEGSFGRDTADRFSDVDAHLLVRAEARDAFAAGAEAWLSQIRPLVLYRTMFGGSMINAMTVDALRLDVWIHKEERMALGGKPVRVLFDKEARLDLQTPDSESPSPEQRRAQLAGHVAEFWRMLSLTPTVMGRGERIVGFQGAGFELIPLTEVLLAQAGRGRETGIKQLNEYILPESRRELEAALNLDGLSLEALVGMHLRLARLMQRVGPQVAESVGFDYPHALEQTVLAYVQHELERLGLGEVWQREMG